jgi:hypothetical protein
MEEMKNVEENYNLEQAPNAFNGNIPVMFTMVTGSETTPVEFRIAHAQMVILKPEQWQLFTTRLNDLVSTLNSMAEDNAKTEPKQ